MNNISPIVEERQIDNASSIVLSLEDMIKSHIVSIERLSREMKKQREMVDDGVNNNPTFREQAEKAKKVAAVKAQTKAQIMSQPSMKHLADEVKKLSGEIKEKKSALSDYLLEYQRLTEATQLELFDGSTVSIVKSAKIVRI